ncbi:hypothetical protein [Alkalimarinus coralli]|uniref:hypothetical protein n=1 Tax=Alkalimarinus coralli TaxID=2935863 RepID=UPI00202B1754|nr:hypothetical protein [Alkalimarinus coralli]
MDNQFLIERTQKLIERADAFKHPMLPKEAKEVITEAARLLGELATREVTRGEA